MGLPNDPWELFELDPSSASERDVKRAYAKLLKQYRPDRDAEAFQQIHAAYQYALAEVEHRKYSEISAENEVQEDQTHVASPVGQANEAPQEEPEIILPDDEYSALARQLKAISDADVDRPAQVVLMQKLTTQAKTIPEGDQRWLQALFYVFSRNLAGLSRLIRQDHLTKLLELNQFQAVIPIIDIWKRQLQLEKLQGLRNAIVMHRPAFQTPEAAFTISRLAAALAMHRPEMADKLLNLAFPLLPLNLRDRLVASVENRIHAGKILKGMHPEQLVFWENRLFENPDDPHDWTTADSRAALFYLSNNYAPNWHGYAILQGVMPEHSFAKVQEAARMHAQRNQLRAKHSGSRSKPRNRFVPENSLWLLLSIITILAGIIKPTQSNKTQTIPSYTQPTRAEIEQIRQSFDQFKKPESSSADGFLKELQTRANRSNPQDGRDQEKKSGIPSVKFSTDPVDRRFQSPFSSPSPSD